MSMAWTSTASGRKEARWSFGPACGQSGGRLPHELVDLWFFEVANCATVDILVDVEAGRRYVFVASVQAEDEAAYEITDAETERVVASWDLRR